jgi:hypothetical protein
MEYFQVHDFAPVIDGFVFDIVMDAMIQNELKVITFTIMSNDSVLLMSFMNKPLAKFLYGLKIVLFTTHILLGTDKPSAPWFKTGLNH